jgi:hypothetical protein
MRRSVGRLLVAAAVFAGLVGCQCTSSSEFDGDLVDTPLTRMMPESSGAITGSSGCRRESATSESSLSSNGSPFVAQCDERGLRRACRVTLRCGS